MTTITRPALRYHGGKFQIADWIIKKMPAHKIYVEPFGGGASIILLKQPAFLDVYNDLNGMVVNFFSVLRDREQELIRAIELTPFSRLEFKNAQTMTGNPLEDARRFYIWAWQGRGRAGVVERGGWRYMRTDSRGNTTVEDWNNIGHLWAIAARLKKIQIESLDAMDMIKKYDSPKTLFYVDPPYIQSTRSNRWGTHAYSYEYTDEQHRQLSDLLQRCAGAVMLSGYDSGLYRDLYKDWNCYRKSVAKDNNAGAALECLWLNTNCQELTLFNSIQP